MTIMRPRCSAGRMIHRRLQPLFLATIVSIIGGCAAAPPVPQPAVPPPTSTAQVGDTTVVAVAPAAAPCCKQTLPEFLGITGLFKLAGQGLGGLRNRLGMRFPGLEPGPPILAITDPANAGPNQPPAVQAAAAIKAEEGAAPQKVKAIRFLAGVGCGGCYPDVEKSFLAALDDCTEAVRYEAVKAIRSTAGSPCQFCRGDSCCSPKVLKKLSSVASDTTDSGCYKEPSDRVRRIARLAMNACGGAVSADSVAPQEGPSEEIDSGDPAPPDDPPGVALSQESRTFSSALALLRSGSNPSARSPEGSASPGAIAARVNGEPILWNEILARLGPEPADLASTGTTPVTLREDRIRDRLQRAIDNRLLSQEARRRMPPDEIHRAVYLAAEGRVPGEFAGETPVVVTATVRDEILAGEWVKRCVYVSPEISRPEIYDYYRANFERYRESGYVRWEQLSARFDRFASREQSNQALSYVRVKILGDSSDWPQGVNLGAIESVRREATSDAELPNGPIGQALTILPVGQTSPILQDADGVHRVRVLDRREPRTRPLDEVIDTVRNDMQQQRHSQLVAEHLQQLRRATYIWIAPRVQVAGESPIDRARPAALRKLPPVDPWPRANPGAPGTKWQRSGEFSPVGYPSAARHLPLNRG